MNLCSRKCIILSLENLLLPTSKPEFKLVLNFQGQWLLIAAVLQPSKRIIWITLTGYNEYIQILLVFTLLLPPSTRERKERVNRKESTPIPADSCAAPNTAHRGHEVPWAFQSLSTKTLDPPHAEDPRHASGGNFWEGIYCYINQSGLREEIKEFLGKHHPRIRHTMGRPS